MVPRMCTGLAAPLQLLVSTLIEQQPRASRSSLLLAFTSVNVWHMFLRSLANGCEHIITERSACLGGSWVYTLAWLGLWIVLALSRRDLTSKCMAIKTAVSC